MFKKYSQRCPEMGRGFLKTAKDLSKTHRDSQRHRKFQPIGIKTLKDLCVALILWIFRYSVCFCMSLGIIDSLQRYETFS